jgi:hypothetical protein
MTHRSRALQVANLVKSGRELERRTPYTTRVRPRYMVKLQGRVDATHPDSEG